MARTNSAGPGPLRCRLAAVRSGLLASVDRRHPAMQPGKAREVALQQLHVLAVLGGEGVELVTQRLDIRRDAIEVARIVLIFSCALSRPMQDCKTLITSFIDQAESLVVIGYATTPMSRLNPSLAVRQSVVRKNVR